MSTVPASFDYDQVFASLDQDYIEWKIRWVDQLNILNDQVFFFKGKGIFQEDSMGSDCGKVVQEAGKMFSQIHLPLSECFEY